VVCGDALILKHFRHLHVGVNPDVEITRFLTERTDFRHTPRLCGSLEYHDAQGVWSVALAQEVEKDAGRGWQFLLDRLPAGDAALGALARLGRVTAALHRALASAGAAGAEMAPEPLTAEHRTAGTGKGEH